MKWVNLLFFTGLFWLLTALFRGDERVLSVRSGERCLCRCELSAVNCTIVLAALCLSICVVRNPMKFWSDYSVVFSLAGD